MMRFARVAGFMGGVSLRLKLWAVFGAMVLGMGVALGLSVHNQLRVDERFQAITGTDWDKVELAAQIRDHVGTGARLTTELLLQQGGEGSSRLERAAKASDTRSGKGIETLQQVVADDAAAKARVAEILVKAEAYHTLWAKSVALRAEGKTDEARDSWRAAALPALDEYRGALDEYLGALRTEVNDSVAVVREQNRRSMYIMIGVCAFAVCFGLFAVWAVIRATVMRVDSAVRLAVAIGEGDLSGRVEPSGTDEIGRLLAALAQMQRRLGTMVHDIRGVSHGIAERSRELASGNSDLSKRTESQATSLQETTSSMELLTATVKQNAGNAREANRLASGASDVAVRGGEAVRLVVGTMEEISAASNKIADIISVIDGIAFQTNILALNAAVEAARAGEQGRGFAVVAAEVRSLAQRSAVAAKEIKGLIGASATSVTTGATQVGDAGRTMQEIVMAVKKVTDIMGEISSSTREQSSGIEQVNHAVTSMDSTTQQNAALVEQAAAAAESLQLQAQELAAMVAAFKVGTDAPESPASQLPPLVDASQAEVVVIGRGVPSAREPSTHQRQANVARLPARTTVARAARINAGRV